MENLYDVSPKLTFREAINKCFRGYFDFDGRARRSEYWYWQLFYILLFLLLIVIYMLIIELADNKYIIYFIKGLCWLCYIGILIPDLAVLVRRLHDTGKSGWLLVIPYVALLLLWGTFISYYIYVVLNILIFIVLIKDSDCDENYYGDSPKYTLIKEN